MTEKEHINQYIKSTCDLIIQHVKNIITLQENINKPWGYSSRLMEHLFHPENELLFKGYSKNIFNNKSAMAIKPWKEHIVPMAYVFNNLWVLIESNELSDAELSKILQRNLGVAHISYEEQKKLDTKFSGLKTNMPNGWCLKTGDPIDRLKAVGIELVDENGFEIQSLITPI